MDNEEMNTQETNNDVETKYNEFLKQQIKEYCNADNEYEIYWDYKDIEEFTKSLPSMLVDYDGQEDFVDFIYEQVNESFMNGGYYPEDDFTQAIYDNANSLDDEEFVDYFNSKWDNGDIMEDLYANGYNGVDYNIDEIINKVHLPINIMIAPYNERNYDMGSIITAFGSDYLPATNGKDIEPEYLDNGITYLVHQQGHSLKEIFDDIYGENSSNKFIRSVVAEIHNNPAEAMSGLTVLVNVNGNTYGELLKAQKSDNGYIEVPVNTPIGIFNPWIGTGSIFEIELEKPFIFSASDIQNIQLDDISSSGSYSVSDVYGGFDRDNDITFTNAPELYQEDLEEVLQYVADKYGNEVDNNE